MKVRLTLTYPTPDSGLTDTYGLGGYPRGFLDKGVILQLRRVHLSVAQFYSLCVITLPRRSFRLRLWIVTEPQGNA